LSGAIVGKDTVIFLMQACLVEEEEEEEGEAITFLYKFMKGSCPKSYGFNVAHLAGLPPGVISLAKKKASTIEREALMRYSC
jgi:DNA mismatch repair protein MSH6